MAYPVSISFSAPLCAAENPIKQIYCEKTALAGLSKKATAKTGTHCLASRSSIRGLFSVNLSCHRHLTSSSKHLGGIVSCLDLECCHIENLIAVIMLEVFLVQTKIKCYCVRLLLRYFGHREKDYEVRCHDSMVGAHGNNIYSKDIVPGKTITEFFSPISLHPVS
ncbi:hypothetical protein OWV82_007396 [Melia azedarach]|uniref:Uncharacterized protein n=1 Tax=Melia azedarach TaxID=155640 RepID=A0ACC1Y7J2_MELAZ|nr:hypothetical protein OWV82_007396 [Melia azedarach]